MKKAKIKEVPLLKSEVHLKKQRIWLSGSDEHYEAKPSPISLQNSSLFIFLPKSLFTIMTRPETMYFLLRSVMKFVLNDDESSMDDVLSFTFEFAFMVVIHLVNEFVRVIVFLI